MNITLCSTRSGFSYPNLSVSSSMDSLTLSNKVEISPTIFKTSKLKTDFFPYSFVFCYISDSETNVLLFWAKLDARRYVNIYVTELKRPSVWILSWWLAESEVIVYERKFTVGLSSVIAISVLIRSRDSIVPKVELNKAVGRHMWHCRSRKGLTFAEDGEKNPCLARINSHWPSHCPVSDHRVHAEFLWLWDLHIIPYIAAWGHFTWRVLCSPTSDMFHRSATKQKVTI